MIDEEQKINAGEMVPCEVFLCGGKETVVPLSQQARLSKIRAALAELVKADFRMDVDFRGFQYRQIERK